jgi:hypothetical protein
MVNIPSFSSGAGLGGSQPCQESPAHHEPSPKHEEAQVTMHHETLAVLQEPAAGSSRKNSLMPGSHQSSLRESFRKLVRPLVKLRGGGDNEDEANNSTDDEAAAAASSSWRDFSRRSSRRDSRQSAGAQQQHTPERTPWSGGGGPGGGLNSINSRLRLDDYSLDGNLAEEELCPGGGGDDCESMGGGVPAPDSKWRKILGISLAISRYEKSKVEQI